jgi:membrane fusion protein
VSDTPLFREEVLDERRSQWLGTVLLVPRTSQSVLTIIGASAAFALVALLWFGSYTRTAHIGGWLVPQDGLVQVFAPQSGVVTSVKVREGADVAAGDPLFVLSGEVQSSTRGATGLEVARLLADRRASLQDAVARRSEQETLQKRALTDRLSAIRAELTQLESNIALQRQRAQLAATSQARERELRRQGFVSDEGLQAAEERRIDQFAKLGDLQRSRLALQRDALALREELNSLPLKTAADLAGIQREITGVDQQLAEAESRREVVVPAPAAGVVTTLQAELGGRPGTGVPLLSIVPRGSQLEAHLFTSSKSIGFLRPGQRVRLRYQAYPYQKFGHYDGELASISGTAINPKEMPPQLVGLTSLVGTSDPVYRLVVRLSKQSVSAYGKPIALQPGMQLDADVVIERRRLIEWVLDPLFTITGKWTR